MNKGIITAVMGLGMLYAQAVSANEMVRYEHGIFVADASDTQAVSQPVKKSVNRKYNRRQHPRRHTQQYESNCAGDDCVGGMNQPVYIRSEAAPMPGMTLDNVENNMDIINRDHAARAGRGR